jgi:ribosomal protein L11 methylase PrmA
MRRTRRRYSDKEKEQEEEEDVEQEEEEEGSKHASTFHQNENIIYSIKKQAAFCDSCESTRHTQDSYSTYDI